MSNTLLKTPDAADAVREIAELARQADARAEFVEIPAALVPAGATVKAPHVLVVTDGKGNVEVRTTRNVVDEIRGKPALREGTATTTTLDSFIDLVNRHANAGTAIFVDANWKAPKFTAVIDYHAAVNSTAASVFELPDSVAGDDPHARFGRHRISYAFPLSEPWQVWVANNGKAVSQEDFAAFIEDHIHEIGAKDPDSAREADWEAMFRTRIAQPSELVDLARGLEVHVGARVKSKVKLQSGETQMVFETEHRDAQGNEVSVPGLFLVAVPAFYRGEPLRIPARLRYRAGSSITWAYELFRPDEFVDEHVRTAVERVSAQTGLPVYDGAPESAPR